MFDDRMKLRPLEADGPIQQNVTEHLSMGLDFRSHDATPGTQELNLGHMIGSQQWGKDDDIFNLINYSEQKREKTYIQTKTSSVLGLGCNLL